VGSQKIDQWLSSNRAQTLSNFIVATKLFGGFSMTMVTVPWSKTFMSQFADKVGIWLKPFDTTYTKYSIGLKQTSTGQV